MLDSGILKNLLHQNELSNIDKLLLCMALDVEKPKVVQDIKEIARKSGLRKAQDWNVSSYLSRSNGLAIRVDEGWELTTEGKKRVAQLSGSAISSAVPKIATTLRSHLAGISNADTVAFLDEAIRCFEAKLYRAAVVISWVGAASLLYDYAVQHKLNEFNAEAKRRDTKWKDAKNKDDLANMKEYDFLQVLNTISVIGKSVKDELEGCLKFRNGCGHPNSLKIGESRVSGHIESLTLNVFSKF